MAAIMGTLPMALGTGAGANPRRPLGLSAFGANLRANRHAVSNTGLLHVHLFLPDMAKPGTARKEPDTERLAVSHKPLLAPHAKRIEENP